MSALAGHLASIPGWVWECSWQASLIALAVLLVQSLLGRRLAPSWRCGLWALVVLRLLLPDVPESRTSVYNVVPREFSGSPLWASFADHPEMLIAPQTPPVTEPETNAASVARPVSIPWSLVLGAVWGIVAAALLARLAAGTFRFHRTVRRSGRPLPPELRELLREAAGVLGIRVPGAVETPLVDSPAVTGLWRPLVVLPAGLAQRFSREEIRLLLLHELAHVRRGDLWANLLERILQAIHWFNPVLWFAFRRIRQDRELACDARVLATQQEDGRDRYGRTLIKVLENQQVTGRPAGVVGILEGPGQLRRRLMRIAGYAKPGRLAAVGGSLVAAVLAITLLTRAATGGKRPQAAAETKSAATGGESYSVRILEAARSGDGGGVMAVILESYESNVDIGVAGADAMLDELLEKREAEAFRTLLAQMRMTNLGKDWQPDDGQLAGLVRDGRKDILDILLASKLDVDRLAKAGRGADAEMAGWTQRRAEEVRKERDDATALVAAAGRGDVAEVGRLLDAGVDVNCVGADAHTPLTLAAANNRAEVVRLLLDRGAEVDKPKHPGWDYTPLCLTSSVEVAEMLKAAGANVHAKLFKRDVSILTYVARFGGVKMVQWFFDQGLDPHMIGDNDETLLFDAGDAETMELLLGKGLDPNRRNEFGDTPIMQARDAGSVRALVKHGANVTGFDPPLLRRMTQFGSAEAVEAAIEAGTEHDPETLGRALISAAYMDRAEIVRVLIGHGASANEKSALGMNGGAEMYPLDACCVSGAEEAAKVLLENGADPNAGETPGQMLRNAILNQHKEMVEILRAAGAKGASELACAVATENRSKIEEMLKSAPAYEDDAGFWDGVMSAAAERGNLEAVKAAVQNGMPVRLTTKTGAGWYDGYASAASEGQWEVLEFLLGVRKPDSRDLVGALLGAAQNSHPYDAQRPAGDFEKCVRLLLDAGAPVTEPLDHIVANAVFTRYPGGNARVVEMLAAAGADPNPCVDRDTQKRLLDKIAEACRQKGCSVPDEPVIAMLEKLNGTTVERGK